jgi:hypothetical protein
MTTSGIEPGNVRLVALCLNYLRHPFSTVTPQYSRQYIALRKANLSEVPMETKKYIGDRNVIIEKARF